MMVTVKLFARARELVKTDTISIELPEQATVAEIRRHLGRQYPMLEGLVQRCAIAVDAEFMQDQAKVPAMSEIALLPPVSGG